ncbi:protein phosphatase 2C domain-containing protein [Devosia sp. PTR5]|uniref:Protein phosphatase 2C domain-containing protein n=1 Tax=Devosia oryzisoli TaxID=2774138 RepID=A0A927FXD0_9HYPH|nr:protein phosphatase 2C domain-containing protein [Devosia oryzisoli]MBD8066854.1 protein phosphatase 2C domain-containing protein [Devosia oryzisoli]
MRQLEAFTLGKKFGHPEANEDSLVIMPNLGYAVIDGVTDRNGTRYGGMLSGQFASRTVKRAVEEFLLAQGQPDRPELQFQGGEHFVDYLGKAIYQGYVQNDAVAAVEADWKLRGGCTVMAALLINDRLEVVAVGDSGIRINGADTLQVLKPLDDVTAILRREAWHYFCAQGLTPEECDAQAMAMTWQGTRNQVEGTPTADGAVIETIEARALKACREHLPDVPEDEILLLVQHGIAHGQGNFQNVTDPVLGYGGIDGFAVPARYVETRSYALGDIETIELFSDGYFKLGDGFGVAAWERAFAEVEAEDIHKIGRYMSTKGTTETQLTDDRSYLGVRLK